MNGKSTTRKPRAAQPAKKTDWRRFDALSDEEIMAVTAADPNAAPIIGPEWLGKAKLVAPIRHPRRR